MKAQRVCRLILRVIPMCLPFEGGGGLARDHGVDLAAQGGDYWPLAADPLWV